MITANNKWLACAVLAALIGACGDSGGSNDGEETNNTGDDNNNTSQDAGEPAQPGRAPDEVKPNECGAQADGTPLDTSKKGGCFYFYCYQTEDSLLMQSTMGGGCANETDVAIQCEGQSVRTVSNCAREKAGVLAPEGEVKYGEAVAECARKDPKLAKFSDRCLNCNVASSVCAARKCLIECVTGDSKACDKCREDNGCTPDFYTCAGLPNPNK